MNRRIQKVSWRRALLVSLLLSAWGAAALALPPIAGTDFRINNASLTGGGANPVSANFQALGARAGSPLPALAIATSGNPVPNLASLSPASATEGGGDFTLTVNGAGFDAAAVVRWNGADRTTTFISANQVTAAILAADIAAPGTANVTVFNPAPGGGESAPLTFTIRAVPTVVFVDDDWATATYDLEVYASGDPNPHYVGYDAFAEIQPGINAVAAGGTVNVMNGRYRAYDGAAVAASNTILISKALTLQGESQAGVVIMPAAEDTGTISTTFGVNWQQGIVVNTHDVTLRNLTLDGSANNAANGGSLPDHYNFRCGVLNYDIANVAGDRLRVENVTVRNIRRRGIALWPETSTGHVVDRCDVSYVEYQQPIFVASRDTAVTRNTVSHASCGISVIPSVTYPAGAYEIITSNTLTEIGATATSYYGNSWPVNGLYYRNPTNDRTVTISGNHLEITNPGPLGFVFGAYIYNSDAASALEGNTFDLTNAALLDGDAVYLGGCAGTLLRNNVVAVRANIRGVELGRGAAGVPVPNVVTGNTLTSIASSEGAYPDGSGIFQTNNTALNINGEAPQNVDNLIYGNTISGFVRGVLIDGSAPAGGTCSATLSNNNTISGCAIGVDVKASKASATLSTNEIDACTTYGVSADGGVVVISSSRFETNAVAIASLNGGNATINNNEILNNTGGVLVDATGAAALAGNNLAGNSAFGAQAAGPAVINAQNNWWGSYAGPGALDGGGRTGDAAIASVDASNFARGAFRVDSDGDGIDDNLDTDDDQDLFPDLYETLHGWDELDSFDPSPGGQNYAYVDDDWSGNPPGFDLSLGRIFGINAFDTITSAVIALYDGGTAYVANGLYTESVAITKPVTVRGQSQANVIVQAGAGAPVNGVNVFDVNPGACGAVLLERLTLRNGDYGLRALSGEVRALYCTFTNNGYDGAPYPFPPTQAGAAGVFAAHATDGGALRIENACAAEIGWCNIEYNDRGAVIAETPNAWIHGNIIHDNIRAGVNLATNVSGCTGALIENNTIYNNYHNGILVTGGNANVVQLNNIFSNWNNGIQLYYPSDFVVDQNTLSNNSLYGFNGQGLAGDSAGGLGMAAGTLVPPTSYNALISNNILALNNAGAQAQSSGIHLGAGLGANGIYIQGNSFASHDRGVWVQSAAATTQIYSNRFDGAGLGAVNDMAGTPVDAGGNSWGATTPAGVAAEAGANVDYSPWLIFDTDANPVAPGFQGNFTQLWADDNSPRAGGQEQIRKAVTMLASGGTLTLANGTYLTNDTLLDKPLLLQGESRAGTIVAPASAYVEGTNNTYGFTYDAAGVTIRDLTIDGGANGGLPPGSHFRYAVRYLPGTNHSDLRIERVTVTRIGRHGMMLGADAAPRVNNIVVTDCTIDPAAYFSLYIWYATSEVSDCVINGGPASGAVGNVYGHMEFLRNIVNGGGGQYGCVTYTSSVDPIGLRGTVNAEGNTVTNALYGLVAQGDGTFTGNTVTLSADNTVGLFSAGDRYPLPNLIYARGNNVTVTGNGALGMFLVNLADGSVVGGPNPADRNTVSLPSGNGGVGAILEWTPPGNRPVFQNNEILAAGTNSGLWLYHNDATTSPLIVNNVFTATASVSSAPGEGTGILLTDDGAFVGETGGGDSYAELLGNTITGFATGAHLYRNEDNNPAAKEVVAFFGGDGPREGNAISSATLGLVVEDTDGTLNGRQASAAFLGAGASVDQATTAVLVAGGEAYIRHANISNAQTGALVLDEGLLIATTCNIHSHAYAGIVNRNTSTAVSTENVYWGHSSGPGSASPSNNPVVGNVDTSNYAYFGGLPITTATPAGGTFAVNASINDRYPGHRITIPGLTAEAVLVFAPAAERHGVDNAVDYAIQGGAALTGPATLTLQYDPATDLPPGGDETLMVIAQWNGGTMQWDPIYGSLVNTGQKTVTVNINSVSGIYCAAYGPSDVMDWTMFD